MPIAIINRCRAGIDRNKPCLMGIIAKATYRTIAFEQPIHFSVRPTRRRSHALIAERYECCDTNSHPISNLLIILLAPCTTITAGNSDPFAFLIVYAFPFVNEADIGHGPYLPSYRTQPGQVDVVGVSGFHPAIPYKVSFVYV